MAATQLNLADRLVVRQNIVGRCLVVTNNLAIYILNGGMDSDPNHVNLKTWARETLTKLQTIADQVSYHVITQNDYLDHGSGIDDATLSGIVENALKTLFVPPLS
jgi:hypothetical protein